jgi:hypothetical protein
MRLVSLVLCSVALADDAETTYLPPLAGEFRFVWWTGQLTGRSVARRVKKDISMSALLCQEGIADDPA